MAGKGKIWLRSNMDAPEDVYEGGIAKGTASFQRMVMLRQVPMDKTIMTSRLLLIKFRGPSDSLVQSNTRQAHLHRSFIGASFQGVFEIDNRLQCHRRCSVTSNAHRRN